MQVQKLLLINICLMILASIKTLLHILYFLVLVGGREMRVFIDMVCTTLLIDKWRVELAEQHGS